MAGKKESLESQSKLPPSPPRTVLNDMTFGSGNNRSNFLQGVRVVIHFQSKAVKGPTLELPKS